MRRWTLAALLLAALSGPAAAQVMQTGGVIPQHLAMWSTNNVVQDAGGAKALPQGLQPFELGLVAAPNPTGNPFPATATGAGPNGENSCMYDSPLGQAGHYLCLSANLGSNTGSIDFGSIAGGTTGSLQFIINGQKIPFPGPGNGTVIGPNPSVVGDVACWNNLTGTILADCGPTGSVQPLAPTPITADNSTKVATTAWVKNQAYLTSVTLPLPAPGGRLTLQNRIPAMTGSISNSSTIFYTTYNGSTVPVYNGTTDVLLTIPGNQISLVLTSLEEATQNVFDVYAINVSGTVTLCTPTNGGGSSGQGWSGDTGGTNTLRGTGYSQLSFGSRYYVTNANTITHCFGGGSGTTDLGPITANQGTYLGTYYTTTAGATTVNFGGGASGGFANTCLCLWNYYNRVMGSLRNVDIGSPYTYTASSPRQARASTNNLVSFVIGFPEDATNFTYNAQMLISPSGSAVAGPSLDSTTAFSGPRALYDPGAILFAPTNTSASTSNGTNNLQGIHSVNAVEAADGTNSATFDQQSANELNLYMRY